MIKIATIAGSDLVILTGGFDTRKSSIANTSSDCAVSNKRIRAITEYIFVNDEANVRHHATISDQKDDKYYSDHLPVVTEVDLTNRLLFSD